MIEKIKGFNDTAACLIKPRYFANSTACQPSLPGGKDKRFFSIRAWICNIFCYLDFS